MSLADEMSADFLSIHAELPAYVDIGGARLPALVNDGSLSAELELGGFSPLRSLTVRVRRSDLSSTPKVGDLLQYDGAKYRITTINFKKATPIISLECQQQ
ncbi:MAG: hypothetical protein IJ956_06915 [Akkermansia sp.]|nr:hypothetical protein [Akkermansia sp.]